MGRWSGRSISLTGTELAPGKFRYADRADSGVKHALQIFFPEASVPVFGVIAGSEIQRVPFEILFFSHNSLL